jgi:hypothetical protein
MHKEFWVGSLLKEGHLEERETYGVYIKTDHTEIYYRDRRCFRIASSGWLLVLAVLKPHQVERNLRKVHRLLCNEL